jgi:hypothetical protein
MEKKSPLIIAATPKTTDCFYAAVLIATGYVEQQSSQFVDAGAQLLRRVLRRSWRARTVTFPEKASLTRALTSPTYVDPKSHLVKLAAEEFSLCIHTKDERTRQWISVFPEQPHGCESMVSNSKPRCVPKSIYLHWDAFHFDAVPLLEERCGREVVESLRRNFTCSFHTKLKHILLEFRDSVHARLDKLFQEGTSEKRERILARASAFLRELCERSQVETDEGSMKLTIERFCDQIYALLWSRSLRGKAWCILEAFWELENVLNTDDGSSEH